MREADSLVIRIEPAARESPLSARPRQEPRSSVESDVPLTFGPQVGVRLQLDFAIVAGDANLGLAWRSDHSVFALPAISLSRVRMFRILPSHFIHC